MTRDNAQQNSSDSITAPDHLLFFPDRSWAIWRWAGLRGAGFPVSQVLQLAIPACAVATDLFLACEVEAEQVRKQTQALLSNEASNLQGEVRHAWLKALHRVKEGNLPSLTHFTPSPETQVHLDTLAAAYVKRERAYLELTAQFSSATEQTTQLLCEVARTEHFREAVLWQNPRALYDGIDLFLRNSGRLNSKGKQHKLLIAKYLQRYCTKNESIGFFGPVGWGRWVTDGPTLTVHPGPQLLASRTVYFETWGIDMLGETLAQNRALLPWAIPRLLPFLSLQGTILQIPFAPSLQLSEDQASVLAACDGRRTARMVAQEVLKRSLSTLAHEAEVFAILEHFRTTRRLSWTFDVSIEDQYPEYALRQQLEQVAPESLRQEALNGLDQLETARTAIIEAAGDEVQLGQTLKSLNEIFIDITGKNAQRDAGKTYAGRTLVYEDCRRDLELALGPALLQTLAPPLTLLLTSGRWFTSMAARFYRKAFMRVYQELVKKTGSSTVDFVIFWNLIQSLIPDKTSLLMKNTLVPELQKRWAAILNVPTGQRRVHYHSQDLQTLVQEAFHSPHAGWPGGCYHSPDVLIAATSPEAILRDEYQLVLGEFHQGVNTLDSHALLAQHPDIPDLLLSIASDLPEPRITPVFPRHTLPIKRAHATLTLPKDWRLIFGVDSAGVLPERALPLGLLVLEKCEDELVVHTRDKSKQFDLLNVLDSFLSAQSCDNFKIFSSVVYSPRITIDRLIICRETWRFAPAELSWAFSQDPLEAYVGVRRWAHNQQMPRFLFVRTPNEMKPYYVDLSSPVYVDLFARAVRRAQEANSKSEFITISEMLPNPEHAWLPDADGNRYTSEIRITAVDQLKYPTRSSREKSV